MRRPTQTELMEVAYRRFCANGRGQALLGASEALVMDAYRSFAPFGTAPFLFLELPLLGEPHCDVGVGRYRGPFATCDEFAGGDIRCAALARWFDNLVPPQDLLFGIDLVTRHPDVPVSGAYVRHLANLSTAREFFEITGSSAGFDGFRKASERLPEGWKATLAGDYFGRAGSPLRLEAMIRPDILGALANDAQKLREGLRRMAVPFVDDETIQLCQGLFSCGLMASFQFDVFDDGSLASTLSATLFFRAPQAMDGATSEMRRSIRSSMAYVQSVGISDERCRLLEDATFALSAPGFDDEGLPFEVMMLSEPHCCKLKWIDGVLQPARWYHILKASIIRR